MLPTFLSKSIMICLKDSHGRKGPLVDLGSLFQNSNFARKFQDFISPKREKRHSYPVPKIAQMTNDDFPGRVRGSRLQPTEFEEEEDFFDEEWPLPERRARFSREQSFPMHFQTCDIYGG